VWSTRSCAWSTTLFLLAAALLFGGAAGNWFASEQGLLAQMLQLATGSLIMGATVSVAGSLLFGRNPVRWGVGMPMVVYLAGALLAFVTGLDGATTLLCSAPLMLGVSFASGVMSAFLIDGILPRPQKA
jgi:hypothetical protein